MIEWAKAGKEILARRTDIGAAQRVSMEAEVQRMEALGLAHQEAEASEALNLETFAATFANLYPDYLDKGFSPDLQYVLAIDCVAEAEQRNNNYLGTEHMLLGLTRDPNSTTIAMLEKMRVERDKVRSAVDWVVGKGQRMIKGGMGVTPRGKRVLDFAVGEAKLLNHPIVTRGHLLLGLVREDEGIAAGVLESLGVHTGKVRPLVQAAYLPGQ